MFRRTCGLALICALMLVSARAQAQWTFPGDKAFIGAAPGGGDGGMNIDPNKTYSFWSSVSAQYLDVGFYRVDFQGEVGGIADYQHDGYDGGHVQVTSNFYAYDVGTRCKVNSWGLFDDTTLSVYVNCYSPSGAPIDAPFSLNYIQRSALDTGYQESAYVWAYDSSSASYTTGGYGSWSWNSTGQPITVAHQPGTGHYSVTLSGQYAQPNFPDPNSCSVVGSLNGNAQVTAYGWSNAYCDVGGWYVSENGTLVDVYCFDGSTGQPTESQFDLRFSSQSPTDLSNSGYAWASNPYADGYAADSNYAADMAVVNDANGCPQYMYPTASITRYQTGFYSVVFPYIAPAIDPDPEVPNSPVTVEVTSYGAAGGNCQWVSYDANLNANSINDWDAKVGVMCFDSTGHAADGDFTIAFGWGSPGSGVFPPD